MTKKNNSNEANRGSTIEASEGMSGKIENVKKLEAKDKEKEEDLSSESSSSEEDDDDDLVLEGVLVRNPNVSSSSSSDDDDNDDDPKEPQDQTNGQSKCKAAAGTSSKKKRKKKHAGANKPKNPREEDNEDHDDSSDSSSSDDDDDLQVEFVFCDMAATYWDGLKSLLFNSSTVYQAHSSGLADLMIENVSVGTVVSTQDNNADGTVFGFCSLLSISNNQESPAMQYLIEYAQKDCPSQYKSQLSNILSTSSSSSNNKKEKKMTQTGFLLHGRMINLPLEIVHVLYQQVIQDWDWAVENAEGGEEERESYNFQHIVRLAPCTKIPSMASTAAAPGKKNKKKISKNADSSSSSCNLIYRYFDDELLAARADLKFVIPAPKSYSKEEELWLEVIVLTRQRFHDAIQHDLQRLASQP
jgi:protein BCP1